MTGKEINGASVTIHEFNIVLCDDIEIELSMFGACLLLGAIPQTNKRGCQEIRNSTRQIKEDDNKYEEHKMIAMKEW